MAKQEENIEANICLYLISRKISVDKISSEGFYDQKNWIYRKRKSSFSTRGISDLIATIPPTGRALYIEVKTPQEMNFFDCTEKEMIEKMQKSKAKVLKEYIHWLEQIQFLDKKRKNWAVAFFSSSVDQTKERLDFYLSL